MQVNMLDAKSQLSKLVKAALEGEDVVIANKGVPAVRLVPIEAAQFRRRPGTWSHLKMRETALADAFSPETKGIVAAMFDAALGGDSADIKLPAKQKLARSRSRKP